MLRAAVPGGLAAGKMIRTASANQPHMLYWWDAPQLYISADFFDFPGLKYLYISTILNMCDIYIHIYNLFIYLYIYIFICAYLCLCLASGLTFWPEIDLRNGKWFEQKSHCWAQHISAKQRVQSGGAERSSQPRNPGKDCSVLCWGDGVSSSSVHLCPRIRNRKQAKHILQDQKVIKGGWKLRE